MSSFIFCEYVPLWPRPCHRGRSIQTDERSANKNASRAKGTPAARAQAKTRTERKKRTVAQALTGTSQFSAKICSRISHGSIYAGRSAQKINSRARGAITSHGTHPHTKLINHLARNRSVTSHSSLTRRMDTQTPPGGDFRPYSGRTRR